MFALHRHRLGIYQSGQPYAVHSSAVDYITPQGITHPYGGILGILGAAGVVFFAYIGFDAVSTAAQEARNPKRDMPIGILGSLVFCTILYVLFSYVLSGVATVEDFRSRRQRSLSRVRDQEIHDWIRLAVPGGIGRDSGRIHVCHSRDVARPIACFLFDEPRRTGSEVFSEVHPKFRTPWKSNILFFFFTGAFAAFMPEDVVGEMTSIGTLFAFILVCAGVWIMRVARPDLNAGFAFRPCRWSRCSASSFAAR